MTDYVEQDTALMPLNTKMEIADKNKVAYGLNFKSISKQDWLQICFKVAELMRKF